MKTPFGFSTGSIYKLGLSTNESIKVIKDLGVNAIELGYGTADRLISDPLDQVDVSLLENFDYISIHAPARNIDYSNKTAVAKLFKQLQALNNRIAINLVVFHPDTISDLSILDNFSVPIGIENMDNRKKKFQWTDELKTLFELHPSFKMVLDTNHCYTNDRSMKLADDLTANFKHRIKEIHLSGYETLHDPLYKTKQDIIIEKSKIGVPIIIESTFESLEDLEKEYNYIKERLN